MDKDKFIGNGPSINDTIFRFALIIAWNNTPSFKRTSKELLFNIIPAIFASAKIQEKINKMHTD